ncbi:MAG TPA: hypothetical protein DIC52_13530 [Candidatus Latescibacteria bacterium]|nr:hypothetical protein [Candidatus Latescibacterota bacterium]
MGQMLSSKEVTFDDGKTTKGTPRKPPTLPAPPSVLLYWWMITHVDGIAAAAVAGQPQPLFPNLDSVTSWRRFELLDLPAAGVCVTDDVGEEAGYLLLSGQVTIEQDQMQVEGHAPAAIRCLANRPHRVVAGQLGARLLRIGVDTAGVNGGELAMDVMARDRLPWRDAIHGGGGRIGTRHLFGPQDFASSWTFVDHAILSASSSLGYHYHDHLEEAFVVLSGRGWMTLGDTTVEIGPGDVTLQQANVRHGLYNPFTADLDFVRVAVATPGQTFTTIDVADDLRARRPTQENRT